jgi:hypothetical protein
MELLKVVFQRADALNGYWNLYIVVALGVLGVMASGKSFTKRPSIKLLLSLAFAGFAYSNLDVLYHTNEQRRILIGLVEPLYRAAADHAAPASNLALLSFHVFLDIAVVACIWVVPWYTGDAGEG